MERTRVTRQALRLIANDLPAADPAAAALLDLLDHYIPGVTGHMERTAALTVRLGLHVELPAPVLGLAVRTAWLHDVGKLKVPLWVLDKSGPLSELELRMIREHSVAGERLLERTPGLLPVAPLVRSTHERWDGSGYPDGLAGTAIPLPSRVVAVCDAFDAMTHDRAYRPALTPVRAVWELHKGAGSQFDPDLVDGLCDVLTAGV
ncbi:MAG TPA: HD domain-containing phosphohydrolase [Thermoleophilaceae bacterium]|nr:HD domain-containing phosphohydrolase [Thermoleophilaceae bacterium]